MKKFVILGAVVLFSLFTISTRAQEIKHLDAETFRKEIWDYKNNGSEWKFNGDTPVVIDFYATWCGPCRQVAPILKKLQKEYKGKLVIYKVNVDKEKELTGVFGIRSMPTFLFIPKKGNPVMTKGAMPKESFQKIFRELFKL